MQKVKSNVHDDDVFQVVVRGMYAGIPTPFVKHPLKSDVTDPNALWRELAAIADKKLQLPYNDVDAQLRYLHFNAEAAKIRKQLNDDLTELYRPVREADAETDKAKRAPDLGRALATYRTKIKPKFEDAGRAYAANVAPVAKAIDDDFAANGNRLPKEATTVKVGDLTKWSDEATEYDDKISNAQASLSVDDLAKVDPDYAYPGDSFPYRGAGMTRWLLVLAACSASSTQQPVPRAPTSRSNVPKSATPPVAQRSADVGPDLDGEPAKLPLPHDHEAVLVTRTQVIVLGDDDPAHVRVESLDAPATGMRSADGTWGVRLDHARRAIVMEPADVVVHRGTPLVRFLGSLEGQRTVVLDDSNTGTFIARSQTSGATWTETRLLISGSVLASSRHAYNLVTRDDDWVQIDEQGDVKTTPIKHVVPDWHACASAVMWVPQGKELWWFESSARNGKVDVRAQGDLTCAGDAVLVPVEAGLTRCTQGGCGPVASPGDFADLTSDGLVTATQRGDRVRVERTHAAATAHDAPVEIPLAPGDRLVGLVVWKDAPTLIVLGTSRRLHLVVP